MVPFVQVVLSTEMRQVSWMWGLTGGGAMGGGYIYPMGPAGSARLDYGSGGVTVLLCKLRNY
jgi:hypothetical protein